MEWKPWTLALFMALLNSQLLVFQDCLEGNGRLETEESNSMPIKSFNTSHPHMGASENSYFSGTPRTPQTMEGPH